MTITITYLFILIDLFFVIVGGNALSITIAGITIRYGEILSILLGIYFIFYYVKRKQEIRFGKSIILLFLWSILSIFLILINGIFIYRFSVHDILVAFMYLFRFVYSILFVYIVARYIKWQNKQIATLKYVNFLYILTCIIGIFQLIFYPVANDWYDLFQSFGVDWIGDPHIDRLVSTDFDPNYFASCLLIGVAVNFILLRYERKSGLANGRNIKRYFIFILYVISMLLTKSRSGILGLAIFFIIYFLLAFDFSSIRLRHLVTGGVILCVALYLLVFSDIDVFVRIRSVFTDASAGARFDSWAKGFEIIAKTCLMGIGYNLYGAYNLRFYNADAMSNAVAGMDSSLQFVFVTTGIIGFIIFLAHIYYLWREAGKSFETKSVIIAALIISNFNNLLFYSLWLMPYYLLIYLSKELFEGVASPDFVMNDRALSKICFQKER